jgi:hypothetical protein
MNLGHGIPPGWLRLLGAGVGLALIAATANPRLAAVAGVATGAVAGTRLRYSTFFALALLATVGCVAVIYAGR